MNNKKILSYVDNLNNLENKTVIITGANSGLGFSISKFLLYKKAHIVMACRSLTKANKAKEELLLINPNANIDIVYYDQTNFDSINDFINIIKEKYSSFYALILNAGIMNNKKYDEKTKSNLVALTNTIGLYYLINNLQSFLLNSKDEKRIIFQGSLASKISKYKGFNKSYQLVKGFYSYNVSKLGVSNIYYHFYKMNTNENVKYLLSEPGIASTDIVREYKNWFQKIAKGFMKTVFNSADEGSLPSMVLVSNLDIKNGDYYNPTYFLSTCGKPKKRILKKKYVNSNIISDIDKHISSII